MTFDRFDVALTRFPFTDRVGQKVRPIVVLSNKDFHQAHDHLIASMVTTAARTRWPTDIPIERYKDAGLKTPCVIRLKLFTLQLDLMFGSVGGLVEVDRARLRSVIQQTLTPE